MARLNLQTTQLYNWTAVHFIQHHLGRFNCIEGHILTLPKIVESMCVVQVNFLYVKLCSIGASIVVESQRVPQIFQQLMNNPLCFLLYEEQQSTPDEWSGVRM